MFPPDCEEFSQLKSIIEKGFVYLFLCFFHRSACFPWQFRKMVKILQFFSSVQMKSHCFTITEIERKKRHQCDSVRHKEAVSQMLKVIWSSLCFFSLIPFISKVSSVTIFFTKLECNSSFWTFWNLNLQISIWDF